MHYITENNAKVELASPWQRIAAYLINITIYNLILYIVMHQLSPEYGMSELELWFLLDDYATKPIFSFFFTDGSYDPSYISRYILWPIFLFFIWQAVQMSLTGQSIGKKLMKIRVISTSGQSSGFAITVFNREIIFNILTSCILVLALLPIDTIPAIISMLLESIMITNISFDIFLFFLFLYKFLFQFICFIMLFNKKTNHRTWQDYIANTIVVKV